MAPTYKKHIDLVNQQIKELIGVYRDAARTLDISESEFWVWYTLVTMDGDHTQQDICQTWSLPKQTVNTVISHMRRRKYAYLEAVPGWRSRKTIYLTPEGRKYGEELVRPVMQAEKRAFEKMPEEDLALVTAAFAKYIRAIREELHDSACE